MKGCWCTSIHDVTRRCSVPWILLSQVLVNSSNKLSCSSSSSSSVMWLMHAWFHNDVSSKSHPPRSTSIVDIQHWFVAKLCDIIASRATGSSRPSSLLILAPSTVANWQWDRRFGTELWCRGRHLTVREWKWMVLFVQSFRTASHCSSV